MNCLFFKISETKFMGYLCFYCIACNFKFKSKEHNISMYQLMYANRFSIKQHTENNRKQM